MRCLNAEAQLATPFLMRCDGRFGWHRHRAPHRKSSTQLSRAARMAILLLSGGPTIALAFDAEHNVVQIKCITLSVAVVIRNQLTSGPCEEYIAILTNTKHDVANSPAFLPLSLSPSFSPLVSVGRSGFPYLRPLAVCNTKCIRSG